jgi:BirA family transcriptional regulator, biotin operon repressor / biotin---[acetyl-CoA-carboxylase] ligase
MMSVGLPPEYRLVELAETESTNLACLEAAKNGASGGLWIVAKRQTAGRGSRGRQWVSAEGNLYASLLLDEQSEPEKLSQLTFVASLAVRDAILQLADEQSSVIEAKLKWPNDVLISEKKVAGILLESHMLDERRIVIVGIGLNCAHHPANTAWPATSLAEAGILINATIAVQAVAAHLDRWLKVWQNGQNFQAIRQRWLDAAKGVGEKITVRMADRELTGIFENLDDTGRLVLCKAGGDRIHVSAADIFFEPGQNW